MIYRFFILALAWLSLNVTAKELVREFKVTSVQYRIDSKDYRIIFKGQAGTYYSSDELITQCLMKSIEDKTRVKVVLDSKSQKVTECHLIK